MEKSYVEDYYIKILFDKMKIKEVMETSIVTIRANENLSAAEEKFLGKGTPYLFVVNKNRQLVGLLSQKYLYKTQSPRKKITDEMEFSPDLIFDGDSYFSKESLNSFFLHNVMQQDPKRMRDNESLSSAILFMVENRMGCVPVVDAKDKIVGALTNESIIKFLGDVVREK